MCSSCSSTRPEYRERGKEGQRSRAGARLEVKTGIGSRLLLEDGGALRPPVRLLRLIVLLMVMLAVVGAINVGVLERAGEFGTMRALGNTSWDVMRVVIIEGTLLGTIGALAGVALGIGLGLLISKIGIPMPPRRTPILNSRL